MWRQLNESLPWQFPVSEDVLSSYFPNLSRDKSLATFILTLLDSLFCYNKRMSSRPAFLAGLLFASHAVCIALESQVNRKTLKSSHSPKSASS